MSRVVWGTFQIAQSATWSMNVEFPVPFNTMMGGLSFFSFDFAALECAVKPSNQLTSVYLWSVGPVVIAVLLAVLHAVRRWRNGGPSSVLNRQHAYWYLLLSFLVLPPVMRKQLQALDCVSVAGGLYLRVDTSVVCSGPKYSFFVVIDALLITVYMSIPLVWLVLLCRTRAQLNPLPDDEPRSRFQRDSNSELSHLRFLFQPYRTQFYAVEPLELIRRIAFVGFLPLVSPRTSRRAVGGLILSLLSLAVYREVEPFALPATNTLVYIAQYGILLTYAGALAIETDITKNMNSFAFGMCLVVANLSVFLMAVGIASSRHWKLGRWLPHLDEKGLHVLRAVRNGEFTAEDPAAPGEGDMELAVSGGEKDNHIISNTELLKQYIIDFKSVEISKRIGSGAFGEVFGGTVFGQPVAIKTLIDVTEESARAFRAEILLTAALRHPNIVNFVGACWDSELVCLVLEWVPRGSLSCVLQHEAASPMTWADPLLRLAADVARGMGYLHGRRYFDEQDMRMKECIIHRDLKPDNVLVSGFMTAKISDFGTSRARAVEDVTMTAVGTPLFCAPEIFRGEAYDEKVDVYAFGLTLIDMMTTEPLLDFIGSRWAVAFGKRAAPKQAMKLIHSMTEDGWRPVTTGNPVPGAPPAVAALAVRCCSHIPSQRPSFAEVLEVLDGPCKSEVQAGDFLREGSTPPKVALEARNLDADITRMSENPMRESMRENHGKT